MNNCDEKLVILKSYIKHQDIGGKEFLINRKGKLSYLIDKDLDKFTIAEINFIKRRSDLLWGNYNLNIYYGHIISTGLGYYIAEDEIDFDRN